ncbi:MAG: hypothetical protein KA124_01795 [Luteimonas sp.]|nr:hypothetical protein [Luteimonas sp.]
MASGLRAVGRAQAWLLVAACLLPVFPAAAQEIEAHRRITVLDQFQHDWSQVVQSHLEVTRSKAEFNRLIAAARRDFQQSREGTAGRAKSAEQLSRLLAGKDMVYMTLYLSEGFTDSSIGRVKGLMAISGGELDGGVYGDGWNAFISWVRGVRGAFGIEHDGRQLFLNPLDPGSKDRLVAALERNQPLYEAYRSLRDQQELNGGVSQADLAETARREDIQRRADAARTADGGVALHEQKLVPLAPWMLAEFPEGEFQRQLFQSSAGTRILSCEYGPSLIAPGEGGYSTYHFWHEHAPADIDDLLQQDRRRVLRFQGREAVPVCPASDVQALALRRKAIEGHPHADPAAASAPQSRRGPQPAPAARKPDRSREDIRKAARQADELRRRLRGL